MQPQKSPIFLVGAPRSGTTLLRQILDSHSNISITPESSFVFRMPKLAYLYGDLDIVKNRKKFIKDLLRIDLVKTWFPSQYSVDRILDLLPKDGVAIKDIIEIIFKIYARSKGKPRWGDKTPKNLFSVPYILKDYPDAKIVIVVRDGRDVALSLKKVDFGSKSLIKSAFEWKKYINFANQIISNYPKTQIYKIKFEDYTASPEDSIRKVLNFLGEEYEKDLLQKYEKHEDDVRHSKSKHYGKKITTENTNKWEKQMTKTELNTFEKIAGAELESEGYEITTHKKALPIPILKIQSNISEGLRLFFNARYRHNYINFLLLVAGRVIRNLFGQT